MDRPSPRRASTGGVSIAGLSSQPAHSAQQQAAELRTVTLFPSTGTAVGDATRYLGKPVWVFMRVDHGIPDGTFRCMADLKDGTTIPIGNLTVTDGEGAWVATPQHQR
jgi:hypothetical protein